MAVLFILAVVFGLVWVVEFAQLMALRDEDFPGRHDKALWVAAFVFGNVLGAVAFFLWKRDRAFEATESALLKAARDHLPKTPPGPAPAAEQPPPPPASSTAIQRPAGSGA
jgi:hypothetical protein